MPPSSPLLKNDGPACRICKCTEHNACRVVVRGRNEDGTLRQLDIVSCHWADSSKDLCSACAGTPADLLDAMNRMNAGLNSRDRVRRIGMAAVMRRHKRLTEESQC